MNLGYVFRTMTYPHLYELSLANCNVCGDTLIDFILRHRQTLHRLSLQNMMLGTRTWPELFSSIAGGLPNLHKFAIRGLFFARNELMMDWGMPRRYRKKGTTFFCPARDAIEKYVLMGGLPPWNQILLQDSNLRKPHWEPKREAYVAPGIPDDDQPLDDPARHYQEDEFDA